MKSVSKKLEKIIFEGALSDSPKDPSTTLRVTRENCAQGIFCHSAL